MESYRKILTEVELPDTFSEYQVLCLDDNNTVLFGCVLRKGPAVRIVIEEVVAIQIHEEFCHPDMDRAKGSETPPYSNESESIFYPALEVINSKWISSFSENRLRDHRRKSARHYQFLSYSNVVDVIANKAPVAKGLDVGAYNEIKKYIQGKFT